jgi:diguanylate cyclase (GGDEF)-like protein
LAAAVPANMIAGMSKSTRRRSPGERRLEAYAGWVRSLSEGRHVRPPPLRGRGALRKLGQELEHLSVLLDRRETELRQLFDVIRDAEQGVLLEDVLDRIFDSFSGLIPFDRLGCAFLSPDGQQVTAYWARTKMGPPGIVAGFSQPMGESSLKAILASGGPRIINDLAEYEREHPRSAATHLIVKEGGRSSLTCPLVVDACPIGFLFFTSRENGTYRRLHQDLFLQIAALVAVVIDKSRMFGRLVESNRQLTERGNRLEQAATIDPLTEILNRRGMQEVIASELARATSEGRPVSFIMADIDHFKRINDTYGHQAGDTLLRSFARRLSGALRSSDRIARYGGEEFLVVAVGADGAIGAEIGERLRAAVAGQPFDLAGISVAITASFGVAARNAAAEPADEIVARADTALYAAKEHGRNRVEGAP